jgi:hypothetical protein
VSDGSIPAPYDTTWPRFLPAKQTVSEFFSPLKSRILEWLTSEPTLEAWSEKLLPASKLTYVPEKHMDNDGIPLNLTVSKHNVDISQSYSHDDYEHLKPLNVVEMGDSPFLDHLEETTKHHREYFVGRPPERHFRLAAVLAEIWEAPQTENRRRIFRFSGLCDDDGGRWLSFGNRGRGPFRSRLGESGYQDQANRFQERVMKLPLIQLRDGQ